MMQGFGNLFSGRRFPGLSIWMTLTPLESLVLPQGDDLTDLNCIQGTKF